MRTKTDSLLLHMGTYGNQHGGYRHNVTTGGKDPEQGSPFAEDKRVTLPGDKPGEDGGEVNSYTNHNTVSS